MLAIDLCYYRLAINSLSISHLSFARFFLYLKKVFFFKIKRNLSNKLSFHVIRSLPSPKNLISVVLMLTPSSSFVSLTIVLEGSGSPEKFMSPSFILSEPPIGAVIIPFPQSSTARHV
jgi:hypothetical protein